MNRNDHSHFPPLLLHPSELRPVRNLNFRSMSSADPSRLVVALAGTFGAVFLGCLKPVLVVCEFFPSRGAVDRSFLYEAAGGPNRRL